MGMTADQYREHNQALLPSGPAWTRAPDAVLTTLLDALAQEFARVDVRADELIAELDPRTTTELLEDWERAFGLPAPCMPASQTLADRRAALWAKMTAIGGQSRAYYFEQMRKLGFVSERWTPVAWHFIQSVQGWYATRATLVSGATSVTLTATAADPILARNIKAVAGVKYRYVVARFRRLVASTWEGVVYYQTPAHGEEANFYKNVAEPAGWATGDWITLAWDMHALTAGGSDWLDSYITGLRLDFSNDATLSVEIDWIALSEYPDPDTAITIDEQVDGLPHVWRINSEEQVTVTEFTVNSPCTDALREWGNDLLECVLNPIKPAHTNLRFGYQQL